MLITNQDRDQVLDLSTEDIYYRRHFATIHSRRLFMGWNMYARIKGEEVLLGTFGSYKSCRATLSEMKQHEKAGMQKYIIPEDSDGIEEYEEIGGVENA